MGLHMITRLVLVTLVAGAGLGCGKNLQATQPTVADAGAAGELLAAEAAWAAAKPDCSSYHYQVLASSVFGSCSTTTIEIANDEPIERTFVGYTYGTCGGDAGPSESWDEVGVQQIGTHSDGAPALTVEGLFAACQSSLAVDPAENTIWLTIGADGVPTQCGFTPIDCVDDCPMGFRLAGFACGS